MAFDATPFAGIAQKVQAVTGIPASIILGQIQLESSSGNNLSGLATNAKNLFGVKATKSDKGTAGFGYWTNTKEQDTAGNVYTVKAEFKRYASYMDSILDHARLLMTPRYASKLQGATTVQQYAAGIKAGGYATDTEYVSKLVNTSKKYQQYDLPITGIKNVDLAAAQGKEASTVINVPGGGSLPGNAVAGTWWPEPGQDLKTWFTEDAFIPKFDDIVRPAVEAGEEAVDAARSLPDAIDDAVEAVQDTGKRFFSNTIRFTAIFLLLIVAVIFLMKAFDATPANIEAGVRSTKRTWVDPVSRAASRVRKAIPKGGKTSSGNGNNAGQ
jgi:hypothetical protein